MGRLCDKTYGLGKVKILHHYFVASRERSHKAWMVSTLPQSCEPQDNMKMEVSMRLISPDGAVVARTSFVGQSTASAAV